MLTVSIDRTLCMGAGECVHRLPAVFEFGADRRAVVRVEGLDAVDEESLIDAASCCPNFAIDVERSPS